MNMCEKREWKQRLGKGSKREELIGEKLRELEETD